MIEMFEVFEYMVLILVILVLLACYRLIQGPTVSDRVVALDAVNTLTVGIMIVLGVVFSQSTIVDVAIVYALLSFIGTIYIAKYIGGEI